MDLRVVEPSELEVLLDGRECDLSQYERLLAAIAAKTSRIEAALPEQFACKAGCHHCCQALPTILPVEWAFLRGRDRLPRAALRSDLHPGEDLCDRLEPDGSCAIYTVRPVVCRTQGHLFQLESGDLDHCPWNFETLEEVDDADVFRLESLHTTLLQVNLDFLRRVLGDEATLVAGWRVRFHDGQA